MLSNVVQTWWKFDGSTLASPNLGIHDGGIHEEIVVRGENIVRETPIVQ